MNKLAYPSPFSEIHPRRLVLADTSLLHPTSPLALDVDEALHGIRKVGDNLGENTSY